VDIITKENILDLIDNCEGMAVSIYLPTFDKGRRRRENSIRLKNLVGEVEDKLQSTGTDQQTIAAYLAPLEDLIDNAIFWQDQDKGLALFLDSNALRVYRLPRRFEELVMVGDTFHITPLIPIASGNGQFYLISLDLKHPALYQGSKYQLIRFEDVDLPESLQDMFDKFYEFHSHLQFHTKTRNPNPDLAGNRDGEYFGQGGDDINENAEIRNYFHRLDDELMDFLDGEEIPLVLAGVGYLHPLYQEANTFPNLVEDGITQDVDNLPPEDLHEMAWDRVREKYQKDVEQALGVYHRLAEAEKDVTEDLVEIVKSAQFKRVNSLFIAEDKHVWGNYDVEANEVHVRDEPAAGHQDLIGMAAAQTLKNGGNVLVLPADKVPGDGLAAAILRY
jgi:hypothetical protein